MTDRPAPPAAPPDEGSGGAVQARTLPTDVDERTAELEGVVARLDDQARRALADLDNSHKRHTRDLEQVRANERANVAKQFLPLVDHLELALGHASADPSSIIDGVKHVLAEAVEIFRRLGFERIDQVGVPFDPAKHEAVSAVEVDDVAPGTVVHVVRPGYGEGSRQLRPASVVVSTGPQ